MGSESNRTLQRVFALSGTGFGVFGLVAPSAFVSTYGVTSTSVTDVFVRLFGARAVALGVATLLAEDAPTQRRMFGISTAMNLLDVAVIATAKDAPSRSRALGVATTAAFAAVGAYLRQQSTSS